MEKVWAPGNAANIRLARGPMELTYRKKGENDKPKEKK